MAEVVYVLINQAMPNLVKIGRTDQAIDDRIKQLDSTGVPLPFECFSAFTVANAAEAEKALHTAFGDHRVRDRREFFRISPDKPTAILKVFGKKNVTPGYEVVEDETDKKALEKARKVRSRFNFDMIGLKNGDVLNSVFDADQTCIVSNNNKVIFRDEEQSLSSSALILAHEYGKNWLRVNGPMYWAYEDETLVSLRDQYEEEN